jgi:ABC-type molybdenum transport system ATPase subunit/photorepair protein PhrA
MKLAFNHEYESIKSLATGGEVPKLAILTGINGSGKTHLLQAINSGAVQVVENNNVIQTDRIIYVPFGGLNVTGADSYSSQQAQSIAQQIWDQFSSYRQNFLLQNQNPYDKQLFINYIQAYKNPNDMNTVRIVMAVEHTLRKETKLNIQEITPQHFWKHLFDPNTATSTVDFFEQNFAKIFAEYQISLVKQRFYKYMRGRGYKNAPAVDSASLSSLEANKPWDFVNEVLRTANFDFEVLPPDFWDTEQFNYMIKLKKISTDAEVEFSKLSTGEQVLFALALVRYKAEKKLTNFPEIILLDEPDAPLHPKMTETLLDVLMEVFVEKYNTNIIMTTHSPATVALAPDGSIILVRNTIKPRVTILDPVLKNDALDSLSSGYVAVSTEENQARLTMEVNAVRKPVILTEGGTDKQLLELAWKKLNPGARIPFAVIPCGDAYQVKQKIDATTVEDIDDKAVFGLFDFDNAFNIFKGLKTHNFDTIKGTEKKCLYRVRKSSRNPVIGILLPVPNHRNDYASKSLKGESKLSIELLFEDSVLELTDNIKDVTIAGGTTIKQFQGDKVAFAEKTAPSLDSNAFRNFEPLFKFIVERIA